jgi:hypothetical protein
MQVSEAQAITTIPVQPGSTVTGDLSNPGVLRFERVGLAMMGEPELAIVDGALVLKYDDGTTVRVKT